MDAGHDAICVCSGSGFLWDQTYGEADIPEGWTPVQRCDLCEKYPDDEAAARAAAELDTEAEWCEPPTIVIADEFHDAGHGDWAVRNP